MSMRRGKRPIDSTRKGDSKSKPRGKKAHQRESDRGEKGEGNCPAHIGLIGSVGGRGKKENQGEKRSNPAKGEATCEKEDLDLRIERQ